MDGWIVLVHYRIAIVNARLKSLQLKCPVMI